MKIKFNVTGARRKALVTAIGEIVGEAPVYTGAPTFAYAVGNHLIDKNGTLTGEITRKLLDALAAHGFESPDTMVISLAESVAAPFSESRTGPETLTIEMPKEGFTETALVNLKKLVESKAELIKKALGADSVPVIITDDKVCFPWFPVCSEAELNAYSLFITALCDMAKKQTRVQAKEKPVENEKYAFRCFLLRLGFVGEALKEERKVLLRNLTGDSSFKRGARGRQVAEADADTCAEDA